MKYCIIFIFAFILGACQDVKTQERPANLIDKDKMATILVESYLINAAKSVDNKSIMESGIVLDSVFYSRFKVDSLQFSQSNAYYAANEAEKAAHINIIEVLGFGKFGRVYIGGEEAEVLESKRIVEKRLSEIKGREDYS